MSTEQP